MPENIGHFKVVIEGEIDSKIGDSLEKNITDSSKKGASNLEKQLKKVFESNSFGKFLESNFNISKKISGIFGGGAPKVVETATSAAGGTEVGGMKGLAGMGVKMGMLIGAIMLIVDAVKGLAPIQAILKMLTAIIQITLYPIAQFFLMIFKPIIVLLLKNFIIPFYTKVMPILELLGKWLGGMLSGAAKVVGKAIEDFQESAPGQLLAIWIDSLIAGFQNLITIIAGIIAITVSIITGGFENIMIIITTIMSIIVTIIGGFWETIKVVIDTVLGVVIAIFTGKWDEIPGILLSGWEKIKTIFLETLEKIKTLITDAWKEIKTNILEHLTGIWNTITETWNKIKTNIKETLGKIYDHVVNIFGIDIVKKVKEIFTSIYDLITGTLGNIFNWIIKQINKIPFIGNRGSGGSGGSSQHQYTSNVPIGPGMAEGGIVTSPRVALIGESGPEAVIPLNKIESIGGTTIVNVSFPNMRVEKDVDIDDIVAKIERAFYTNSKRSGVK